MRLTLSEEIGLLHSLTAEELTAAAVLGENHGYEVWPAKLIALRDALYPEEGEPNE